MSGQDPSKTRLYTFKASDGAEVRNAASRNKAYTVRRERLVNWRGEGTPAPSESSSSAAENRPFSPSLNPPFSSQALGTSSAPATMTSSSASYRYPGNSAYATERLMPGFEGAVSYTRQPQSAAELGTDRQRPTALNLQPVPSSSSTHQNPGDQTYAIPRARSWMDTNYSAALGFSQSTAEQSPFSSESSQSQPASYPPSADFLGGTQHQGHQTWNMPYAMSSLPSTAAPCASHGGVDLTLATCQYCGFDYVLDSSGEILGTIRKRFDSHQSHSGAVAQQTQAQYYPTSGTN